MTPIREHADKDNLVQDHEANARHDREFGWSPDTRGYVRSPYRPFFTMPPNLLRDCETDAQADLKIHAWHSTLAL